MHGPAYGAQKAGVDKMAADMAVDFRDTGVATVSIWMGILLTERFRSAFVGHPTRAGRDSQACRNPGVHRPFDQRAVSRSGPRRAVRHTVIGAEIAQRYGITDEDGPAAALAPGRDGRAARAQLSGGALIQLRQHIVGKEVQSTSMPRRRAYRRRADEERSRRSPAFANFGDQLIRRQEAVSAGFPDRFEGPARRADASMSAQFRPTSRHTSLLPRGRDYPPGPRLVRIFAGRSFRGSRAQA